MPRLPKLRRKFPTNQVIVKDGHFQDYAEFYLDDNPIEGETRVEVPYDWLPYINDTIPWSVEDGWDVDAMNALALSVMRDRLNIYFMNKYTHAEVYTRVYTRYIHNRNKVLQLLKMELRSLEDINGRSRQEQERLEEIRPATSEFEARSIVETAKDRAVLADIELYKRYLDEWHEDTLKIEDWRDLEDLENSIETPYFIQQYI